LNSSLSDRAPSSGQELLAEFTLYGRQRPFEEIVRRYAGMVFNVCLRVTKDKHDAEDATQAVFLTLALHAKKQGNEIKALGPWLQQVGKRLALDLRRSKGRRKNREQRHHDEQIVRRGSSSNGNGDSHSLPPADMDEIKAVLHDELQKLPSKYRLPLVLHYFGGLSRDEMAEELGCKASTLGVRIFRGRAMLAGRLHGRGINFTPGMLPLALGYTIKSAVSQAMVASTSHAAAAALAGHDLIGLVSARVIGLTRKAAGAAVIGKLKFAAAILVLAITTLGAGARAFGMLPRINIQEILTQQIHKLIQPLLSPISIPLRVDATPTKPSPVAQPAVQYAMANPIVRAQSPAPVQPVARPIVSSAALAVFADAGLPSSSFQMPLAVKSIVVPVVPTPVVAKPSGSHVDVTASMTVAADTGSSHDPEPANASDPATDANASYKPSDAVINKPTYASASMTVGGGAGVSSSGTAGGSLASAMVASPAENLYLPPSVSDTSAGGATVVYIPSGKGIKTILIADSKPPAPKSASTPVIRIPTQSGLITESNGVVTGYGSTEATGTLDVNAKVIADGDGVDRTMNLSSFASIQDDTANATQGGAAGWYATNHGRLTLALHPSKSGVSAVWGEDPSDPNLDLVNSVRLMPLAQTAGTAAMAAMAVSSSSPLAAAPLNSLPPELSLVSPDRQDLPSLAGIDGQPIGIWQVSSSNDSVAEIACADVTVHYDSSLVTSLGADESDVRLWTYGSDMWTPAASSLDTADDLVTGVASDFNYFAVTVPEPDPSVVSEFAALPSEQITPGAQGVPEPVGISLLATAALLLGRRQSNRRK
jgi:RNA polymerase sigma factor (sigma-70 family)